MARLMMTNMIKYLGIHAKASRYQNGRVGSKQYAPCKRYAPWVLRKARPADIVGAQKTPA